MSSLSRANPLFLKLALIAIITVLLLIPIHQVEGLIAQRAGMRDKAVERVAQGVGHAQTIGMLIMNVPITRSWTEDDQTRSVTKTYRILANAVEVHGIIDSTTRRSGIYQVPTFRARLHIEGSGADIPSGELAPEPGVSKKVGNISLFLAISDPTGIHALSGIRIADHLIALSAATELGLKGVMADLGPIEQNASRIAFSLDLDVAGTQRLQFLPWAASTHVTLSSDWANPSFAGAYAPDLAPQISAQGFAADWRVLEINRDYPQAWVDAAVRGEQILASAFGVDFYQPVDTYQRDYRAIHYAVLFIAISFMVLFLWEHTMGKPVHPIQYAMIGMALSVFYLVLVALSEHETFTLSYTLAAGAMSLLLAVYFSGLMHSRRAGLLTGVVTGTCYSLLYLLVLSEEYALLFGALTLFAILAIIMLATRKLDWYGLTAAVGTDP
jgi:inner membrane protein